MAVLPGLVMSVTDNRFSSGCVARSGHVID